MDKNKLIENLSVGLLCVLIVPVRLSLSIPVAILNERTFFITSISIGILLAAGWILFFFRLKPDYFRREKRRIGSIICQVMSIIIITIFSLGFFIYKSGKDNTFHQKSVVLDEWYYSKTKAGWLKLKVMDRIEKVDVKTSVYRKLQVGDSVDIEIGRGINGFYIIYEINKL